MSALLIKVSIHNIDIDRSLTKIQKVALVVRSFEFIWIYYTVRVGRGRGSKIMIH